MTGRIGNLRRYQCKACGRRFDDLTGTALSGHRQPLSAWVLCLHFMGLNLSNAQIAQELGLNKNDVHAMTEALREGLAKKKSRWRWRGASSATRPTPWPGTRASRRRSPKPDARRAGGG